MLNRYKEVKSPYLSMNTIFKIFINFISLSHRHLKFILSYTRIIRTLCLVSYTLFDSGSSSSSLKKVNKWVYVNILLPFLLIQQWKETILHIHCMNLILHTATTSSNIYCSKPMHLSGLGNKFGLKIIINAIKTPDN